MEQNQFRTPTGQEQAMMAFFAFVLAVAALFGCIIVLLFSNLPAREARNTVEDITPTAEATAEATQSLKIVASPTPLFLGASFATPEPAFQAQSGTLPTVTPWVQTPVPAWQATPYPTWTPPMVSPTPPMVPPLATPVPMPLPPVLNTLPMPPMSVTVPTCSFNPIYMGYDPRIGCRMPLNESIIHGELIVNGQPVSMTVSTGFTYASQPIVAQPGQIIIWATMNQMTCVAWNPPIQLGTTDSVIVRLQTDALRTIDGVIIVHEAFFARNAMNPHPAAHTCGFSPDRTYLRAEIGDSLYRFMLGLDLTPSDYLWNAWYAKYGSYDLVAGTTYAVPSEWIGYYAPITGK